MNPTNRTAPHAAALAALVTALVLAGCVDGPEPASPANKTDEAGPPGRVHGTVTDDELRPLAGARVELVGLETTLTDEKGRYELTAVPPGPWTLRAEAPGFHASSLELVIAPAGDVRQDVRLAPLPTIEPYHLTTPFEGKYECTWEFLIIGGDCFVLYENTTGQPDPLTDDTYAFRLPIGPGWESVVMELTWQSDAANQLDGMRLYLEHGNGSTSGHAITVGRADGNENPLSFVVHRGTPHPRAETYGDSGQPAMIADEGEEAQIRVFPRGKLHETTGSVCSEDGRCFLGIGAGLDIQFTVHATVFYHEAALDGFSAVPGHS